MDHVQYRKIAVTVVVKVASAQKVNVIAAKMAYASKDANATKTAANWKTKLHNLMYFDYRTRGKGKLCPLLRYTPPLSLSHNPLPL